MTLKELFKKHNAQPGFKFKHESSFNPYEVLYIGNESVFTKNIHCEESSFDLDMKGYEKYDPPKKTKKIMVADYYDAQVDCVVTCVNPVTSYRKIPGSDRQIEVECDEAWKANNGGGNV